MIHWIGSSLSQEVRSKVRELEAELTIPRQSANPEEVAEFLRASKLGDVCGADYIEFLKTYREFEPRECLVVTGVKAVIRQYSDIDEFLEIERFFTMSGVANRRPVYAIEWYEGRLPAGFVPIGEDLHGNLFGMSTRPETAGQIWFWTHDGDGDEDYSPETLNFIATDFGDLLARLKVDNRGGGIAVDPASLGEKVDWVVPIGRDQEGQMIPC